jgi:septum site-determining protein MinD
MVAREPSKTFFRGIKMEGISVCIASGKGGVGKSTICANLGIALSQLGVKTIIVDADLEGASIALIFGVSFNAPSLHDCLSGKIDIDDVVFKVQDNSGLELVVGSIRVEALKDIQSELFKDVVTDLSKRYEIVLIDTPAGLGIDAVTAISACDAMLLIVTPDILSVANALKTKVIGEKLGCRILGIVVNRVGGEYDIPLEYLEDLCGLKVVGEIKEDKEVRKSLLEGKLLLFHSPNSPASQGIKRLALDLIGASKKWGDIK